MQLTLSTVKCIWQRTVVSVLAQLGVICVLGADLGFRTLCVQARRVIARVMAELGANCAGKVARCELHTEGVQREMEWLGGNTVSGVSSTRMSRRG